MIEHIKKSLFIISVVLLCLSKIEAKQSVVFLWDIHDVILERDPKKTFNILWNYNNKMNLVTQINGSLFKKSCTFLWRYLTDKTTVAEFIELSQQENNQYLADFALQIAGAYRPIYGTWEIIKELYELGYQHYIGSNISQQSFNDLRNNKKHPAIAPIFSYFDLQYPQIVYLRTSEPKIVKKPARIFFEEYLKNNNIDLKTTRVIFIDDDRNNIITASSMGFIALLFTSPEQLRADLRRLGIPLSEFPVPLFGV